METDRTYINVSGYLLRHNQNFGDRQPPLLVHRFENGAWETVGATEVDILGPCKVVYDPVTPLIEHGAQAWIETKAEVITDNDKGIL